MRMMHVLGAAVLALGLNGASVAQPQRAPAAAAKRWVDVVVRTPEGGYRQGNPNAPVKLVEYGSRTCPSCGRFAAEGMAPLRAEFIASGKVSYEYRDFLIHGAPDLALALVNQCVPAGRFFPVLDAIYAGQSGFAERLDTFLKKSPQVAEGYQKLPPPQMATRFAEVMGVIPFMKAHGLGEAQARKCLNNPALVQGIAKTHADGANLHDVQGTPGFFVNGRAVRAFTWDRLQPELRAAGA
ncbi:DsbA family protein [Sphingomonas xinjiangensis]|uniref:Protein-disulfide isomerase n=1 Tax=Sphingomonas xinjiangensis TaxID=643568 RepID=A0A840YHX5_9SPHN|nr:thioredoxin domain-containing protein [Sphingomonas xinjiangensis]MBB5711639.1 protein-disulfide isomerase [Sphingomonas xinjiangensis]